MSDHHDSNNRRRRLVIGRLTSAKSNSADGPGERGLIVGSAVDDRFCAACGVAGAIVVTIRHRERENDEPVRHTLGHPSVLIGRGNECDISLQDPTVSYRHAYLQLLDGELFCFDLKSRSGTFCRSDRHHSGPLAMGEEILIGPFSLVISTKESADDDESDVAPLSPEQLAEAGEADLAIPETVLKFLNGSPRPEPLALNRPVTLIGKSGRCRVKLADESVSRVHCSIVRTQTGVWVVDLLGKGGTLVGQERVARAPLHEGNELTVGGFRMQVLAAATSRALTRGKAAIARRTNRSAGDRASGSQERQRARSGETGHRPDSAPTLIPQPASRPSAGAPAVSTFSESFVISLVDQFSAMQQQMFEQSQQTMTAMAEILRSRHEAEVGLVRDEMAQIRALSQELHGLSRQLAGRTIEKAEGVADQPVAAANPLAEAATLPQQAEAIDDDQPTAAQSAAEQAAETDVQTAPTIPDSAPVRGETETDTKPTDDVSTTASAIPASETPAIDDDSDEDDPHDWLSQRISAIEKERTSRWQKITRLLSGTAADDRMS